MRILRIVHRWIGLGLVLVLGGVGLTGSLLLFKGPYYRAQWPVLARPIAPEDPSRYARVLESLDVRFPDAAVALVKFPRPGMNAFQVWLSDGREALIDPASGTVLTTWTWLDSLPAFVFELHAHLLAEDAGLLANGVAALCAAFLALSGLLLWWPRRVRAFRFRFAMPRDASPGALLRSHAANGALAALPILFFAGTGAALVFYTPAASAMSRVFDARPPEQPSVVIPARDEARQPWTAVLPALTSALPDGPTVFFYPGTPTNAVWTFRKRLAGEWHPNGRSYVLINPYSAAVMQTIDAREQGAGTRAMFAVYPLHAATVGGPPLVIVAALSGLALAWLSISGLAAYGLAWWSRSRTRRAAAAQREHGVAPRRNPSGALTP
ncbi:MAG: PepSY-associated TM helix domain-containing protein [Vicinamibacterales bacterium]